MTFGIITQSDQDTGSDKTRLSKLKIKCLRFKFTQYNNDIALGRNKKVSTN